jgi:hypothetical protein
MKRIAISSIAVLVTALVVATAPAYAAPTHQYDVSCPHNGYWGGYIKAMPISIDSFPGVGTSVVDGSGYHPDTTEYVYYRVWGYQYSSHRWYTSALKRVLDGYPFYAVQAWDPSVGAWLAAPPSLSNSDMSIGADEVALRIPYGTGRWGISVQTYWAPPTSSTTDPRLQSAAPGGTNVFDSVNGTCTF